MWIDNLIITLTKFIQKEVVPKIPSSIRNFIGQIFDKFIDLVDAINNGIDIVIAKSSELYNFVKEWVLSFIIRYRYRKEKANVETEQYIYNSHNDTVTEIKTYSKGEVPDYIKERLQRHGEVEIDYRDKIIHLGSDNV